MTYVDIPIANMTQNQGGTLRLPSLRSMLSSTAVAEPEQELTVDVAPWPEPTLMEWVEHMLANPDEMPINRHGFLLREISAGGCRMAPQPAEMEIDFAVFFFAELVEHFEDVKGNFDISMHIFTDASVKKKQEATAVSDADITLTAPEDYKAWALSDQGEIIRKSKKARWELHIVPA